MSFPLISRGRDARRAFTLIELLTVIAIIGVLAAITFGAASAISRKSKVDRARFEIAVIAQSLEIYKQNHGDYPYISSNDKNPKAVQIPTTPDPDDRSYQFLRALLGRLDPKGIVFKTTNGTEKYRKAVFDSTHFSLERADKPALPSNWEILPKFVSSTSANDENFANALLDPWGNRYIYLYKEKSSTSDWKNPSFVLMSAGPDGYIEADSAAPIWSFLPRSGIIDDDFIALQNASGRNADNVIYGR